MTRLLTREETSSYIKNAVEKGIDGGVLGWFKKAVKGMNQTPSNRLFGSLGLGSKAVEKLARQTQGNYYSKKELNFSLIEYAAYIVATYKLK